MKRRGQKFRLQDVGLAVPARAVPASMQYVNPVISKAADGVRDFTTKALSILDEFKGEESLHALYKDLTRSFQIYNSALSFVNSAWNKTASQMERAATVS